MYVSSQIILFDSVGTKWVIIWINSDMTTNEDENSVTSYNNSKNKDNIAKSTNNQEKDNINNSSKSKSMDNDDLSAKLKKREIEQLGISPDEILEEEQKRQPFCNEE